MTSPKRWLYALAGLALGLTDFLILRLLGAELRLGELDITWPLLVLFSATFAGFGFAIGRLAEARVRLADDAALIRAQVVELERTHERLLAAETLAGLGRMAASVAHEVRNPLGVIRSSAALIAEGLPPEGEDAEAASFIVEEVDRLDAYVTRILDYARPLVPERRPVALAEVARRAARLAEEHLPELPVLGEAPPVQGDEELLVRSVLGLLINAAEAGASSALLRLGQEDAQAWLEVEDDGPGVDAAVQVFEPFVTTKAKGTGLGLALARRVALAHGGELRLAPASALGGACLRLSLPLEGA